MPREKGERTRGTLDPCVAMIRQNSKWRTYKGESTDAEHRADREKDLIIKAGENISPRAIEEVLFRHPKVSEAAVVGIKDEVYGENLKAFVVLKPGREATAEADPRTLPAKPTPASWCLKR